MIEWTAELIVVTTDWIATHSIQLLMAYFAINICLLLWRRREEQPDRLGYGEGILWLFLGLPRIFYVVFVDPALELAGMIDDY